MIYYCAVFACFILYLRAISMYKLLGAYIRSGYLTEGFHVTSLAGLYLEGIYLIVVNCNLTERERKGRKLCACRWKPILWAQSSTSWNNKKI